MQIGLRVLLIVGAVCMLFFVLNKIRKSQLQTDYAVFWFIFAGCLVIVSMFPQIVYWLCSLIGIESPANLVFLLVFVILIIRLLTASVEIAKLKSKIERLTQSVALFNKDYLDKK